MLEQVERRMMISSGPGEPGNDAEIQQTPVKPEKSRPKTTSAPLRGFGGTSQAHDQEPNGSLCLYQHSKTVILLPAAPEVAERRNT